MEYDPLSMMDSIRNQSEIALKKKMLSLVQYRLLMRHFEKALRAYTYLWVCQILVYCKLLCNKTGNFKKKSCRFLGFFPLILDTCEVDVLFILISCV